MTPVSSLTGSTPEHLTGFQSSPFPYHHGSADEAATISQFPIASPPSDDEQVPPQHYYNEQECQNFSVKQKHFEEEAWKITSLDLVGFFTFVLLLHLLKFKNILSSLLADFLLRCIFLCSCESSSRHTHERSSDVLPF
jgi:hypothetical protein